jgi:methyl-accepting chemotaxis protein
LFGTGIAKADESEEAGEKAVRKALEKMDSEDADFALVFIGPEYSYREVLHAVKHVSNVDNLIGCSTAGEFTEEEFMENSVSIALVKSDDMKFFTSTGENISGNTMAAVEEAAKDLPREVEGYDYMAGINLHDGLSCKGEAITLAAYKLLEMPFSGGSAGDNLKLEKTHVFTEDRILSDGIALAAIASKKPFSFSVSHGHEPISDSMKVTDADGSTVYEIDGEPAIEVWKDAVRERAKEEYDIDVDEIGADSEELGSLFANFELGLETDEGNYKVRWLGPTQIVHGLSGPMEFAVEIPEGARIKVMDTKIEKQIESPRRAAREAVENAETSYSGAMIFECACHAIVLDGEFPKAINAISGQIDAPFAGAETYGEVCMREGKLSGYHNTTTSILLLPE